MLDTVISLINTILEFGGKLLVLHYCWIIFRVFVLSE